MKNYFSDLPQNYDSSSTENENSNTSPSYPAIPIPPEASIIVTAMDITKETIRCFTDYAKCKEHEKTERKRIAATLKAIKYQIDAQKEIYLKELDKQYEERNKLYSMAEKAQEKALNTGDKEMLQLCYNLMLNVYNKPVGSNNITPSLLNEPIDSTDSF